MTVLTRFGFRIIGVILLAAGLLGSCTAALVRPQSGPCFGASRQLWLAKAQASLALQPFQPGPAYDVDANGRAVTVSTRRPAAGAMAVQSYPEPKRFAGAPQGFLPLVTRSFAYDNALYVLWALQQRKVSDARAVLLTLQSLQLPDGAWGFSFALRDDGFYNAAYVRAGTIAWVIYALAKYQSVTGDPEFSLALKRGCQWLLQAEGGTGLVRAGRGRWISDDAFDPDWPADFTATEHQIDAWFALSAAAVADPLVAQELGLVPAAARIRQQLTGVLWIAEQGRFAQGVAAGVVDRVSALDASGTWGALWCHANGLLDRASSSLDHVQAVHAIEVLGWPGWRPYQPGLPATWFVEGSLARSLALYRLGHPELASKAFAPAVDLACAGGVPLVYSPQWAADFPLSPAAAPTLWFLMVGAELAGQPAALWTERAP